ncbi:FHA domain-containing protein [Nocardia sp. CDC153]|uniref:FHA domain-containing protein n=1 Tax=Nocardia sp. CDC153 TaxID=3112167 RepID=UPI002DB8C623|nr:FHA domain-containing protein [Nocardia sp. CDC153]
MLTCPAGHDSAADDYCDVCGLLMVAAETAMPATEPAGIPCPRCGEPQTGRFCEGCSYTSQVRVGRFSASKGIAPEIDLTGPPQDPGVSHLHVLLLSRPENGWAILDLASTNGTRLNDATDPIPRGETVPVRSGDRIHVGAWTTLTLKRDNPS